MTTSTSPARGVTRNRTWKADAAERAIRALGAGSGYFVSLALASWVFNPLREAAIRRGASSLWAILLVAPALLILLAVAAAAAIRLFRVRDRVGDRLCVGAFGATLLLAAELVGGSRVRVWGLYENLTSLAPEPSGLFLGLLVGAVVTPVLESLGKTKPRRFRTD